MTLDQTKQKFHVNLDQAKILQEQLARDTPKSSGELRLIHSTQRNPNINKPL